MSAHVLRESSADSVTWGLKRGWASWWQEQAEKGAAYLTCTGSRHAPNALLSPANSLVFCWFVNSTWTGLIEEPLWLQDVLVRPQTSASQKCWKRNCCGLDMSIWRTKESEARKLWKSREGLTERRKNAEVTSSWTSSDRQFREGPWGSHRNDCGRL